MIHIEAAKKHDFKHGSAQNEFYVTLYHLSGHSKYMLLVYLVFV